MDFNELTRHWDRSGTVDPLWAILTDPTQKGNRWDPEAFFETGRLEIAHLVARLRHTGSARGFRTKVQFHTKVRPGRSD